MTLAEALGEIGRVAAAGAPWILYGGVALPVLGTAGAAIGKRGKTDRDGRWLADATLLVATIAFMALVAGLSVAYGVADISPLGVDVRLLLGPTIALAGSLAGLRLVFPLAELGSARFLRDLVAFIALAAALAWLVSRFRGWGVVFLGGVTQLAAFALFAWALLRRLWKRLGGQRPPAP